MHIYFQNSFCQHPYYLTYQIFCLLLWKLKCQIMILHEISLCDYQCSIDFFVEKKKTAKRDDWAVSVLGLSFEIPHQCSKLWYY